MINFDSSLAAIDHAQLADVTGGFSFKNFAKTYLNAETHIANALIPDKVTLGGAEIPASAEWNIGKIPTPFKDNPRAKIFK